MWTMVLYFKGIQMRRIECSGQWHRLHNGRCKRLYVAAFECRSDGSALRSVYRKAIWTGQYLYFPRLVPIRYKWWLMKLIFLRTRNIYSAETLKEKLVFLADLLIYNCSSETFIKNLIEMEWRIQDMCTCEETCIFTVTFQGKRWRTSNSTLT